MFRYYLLGGDTAATSGLYARLYHAFLVDTFLLTGSLMFGIVYLLMLFQLSRYRLSNIKGPTFVNFITLLDYIGLICNFK